MKALIDITKACALIVCNPEKITITKDQLRANIGRTITIAYVEGVTEYVVALNSKVQLMAAEKIIETLFDDPEVKLYVIETCKGLSFPATKPDKKRYNRVLKHADGVLAAPINETKRVNDLCNEWLVNTVSDVIPIYTGDKFNYLRLLEEVRMKGKGYITTHINDLDSN